MRGLLKAVPEIEMSNGFTQSGTVLFNNLKKEVYKLAEAHSDLLR